MIHNINRAMLQLYKRMVKGSCHTHVSLYLARSTLVAQLSNSAEATAKSSYVHFLLFILKTKKKKQRNFTSSQRIQIPARVCLLLVGRQQLDAAVSLRHCLTFLAEHKKKKNRDRVKIVVYPVCAQNGIAKSPQRNRTREMTQGKVRLVYSAISPSSVHDAS